MQKDTNNTYRWRIYEKILLGFASALGWAPISWVIFMVIFMFLSIMIPPSFPLMEVLFCIYVILSGGLAWFFPKLYILPARALNFLFLILGVQQVVTSITDPYEPVGFYYSESGYTQYHTFSFQNVYLAVLGLFFLIVLFRPALFHISVVWRKAENVLSLKK